MAGPIIRTGETLVAGIRSDFWNTYHTDFDGVLQNLGDVMLLGVTSDKRTEIYGLRKTMPYPELWPLGDPIPEEGTDSIQFSVTNFRYAKRIKWQRDDRSDNLVGDLAGEARTLATNFLSLPSRFLAEILEGSASLLPAIPTCPDGAGLYSATDGASADRFGVSGGNIVSATGVTASAILTDFYSAITRIALFLNSKGQPYFEPDVANEAYIIYAPVTLAKAFTEAFQGPLIHSVESSTGAAVSNAVMVSGVQVTFRFSSRFTTNDWWVFRKDAPVKAVFLQEREPIREAFATEENSDWSRTTGEEYVQFIQRLGVGLNVPFATCKVNAA